MFSYRTIIVNFRIMQRTVAKLFIVALLGTPFLCLNAPAQSGYTHVQVAKRSYKKCAWSLATGLLGGALIGSQTAPKNSPGTFIGGAIGTLSALGLLEWQRYQAHKQAPKLSKILGELDTLMNELREYANTVDSFERLTEQYAELAHWVRRNDSYEAWSAFFRSGAGLHWWEQFSGAYRQFQRVRSVIPHLRKPDQQAMVLLANCLDSLNSFFEGLQQDDEEEETERLEDWLP